MLGTERAEARKSLEETGACWASIPSGTPQNSKQRHATGTAREEIIMNDPPSSVTIYPFCRGRNDQNSRSETLYSLSGKCSLTYQRSPASCPLVCGSADFEH